MEEKYRYSVVLSASRASTISGTIDLTKEEAEIVKRATNLDNWNGRIYLLSSDICFEIDTENPKEIPEVREDRPKLKNVLETISGGTEIHIYTDTTFYKIFKGKMCDVNKKWWEENVGKYLEGEVIRLNVDKDAITICVAI